MARAILGPHYEKYSQVLTAEDEAVLNRLQSKYKESLQSAVSQPAETVVDPWSVSGAVDYVKLTRDFGSLLISDALMDRWQRIMGPEKPIHPWLQRGIFYSHRDLDQILDCVERGRPFYLYTGRGPSSESLHMGHLVPFQFTKWLQDVFDVPLVIQLTDDEKFLFKSELELEQCHRLAFENAKDIIAVGFDVNKTFIFSDLDYIGAMYPNILKIQKRTSSASACAAFGFITAGEEHNPCHEKADERGMVSRVPHNIGQVMFPAVQAAPSFASSFPHIFGTDDKKHKQTMCLIPCAIDQDPYFRLTRDVAPKLGLPKPALLHSKFFPALQGHTSKMSASNSDSCIMVTDTPKEVDKKVKRFAFSGGGATIEEHRAKGGDLEVDVPYQWLRFFEPNDAKLADIAQKYRSGEMLTGEIKQILIDTLNPMLQQQQERRRAVSDDLVRQFMAVRPLVWNQIKPHPDYVPASAGEIESLKLEIEKQGGVVKGMKEAKAAKEDVTAAVQVLNALKDKVCVYSSIPFCTRCNKWLCNFLRKSQFSLHKQLKALTL